MILSSRHPEVGASAFMSKNSATTAVYFGGGAHGVILRTQKPTALDYFPLQYRCVLSAWAGVCGHAAEDARGVSIIDLEGDNPRRT